MVKLVALYKKPANVQVFEEHYSGVHLPLLEKIPGIIKTELSRFFAGPQGEPPFYMMVEAYFADRGSLEAALKSPENRAADQDLMSFAGDLVTVMFADTYESQ
jgi:uncharacterized protein (TIGR02118 family)